MFLTQAIKYEKDIFIENYMFFLQEHKKIFYILLMKKCSKMKFQKDILNSLLKYKSALADITIKLMNQN